MPKEEPTTNNPSRTTQQVQESQQAQQENSVATEQASGEEGLKVKISSSGEGGRVRVIRQTQEPGGSWSGGEELQNNLEEEGEFPLSPQNRIVIEEIG